MSKFSNIFKIASTVAKPFVPGAAGSILEAVNQSIDADNHERATSLVAAEADDQTQAILAMSHIIEDLRNRIAALESK